MREGPQRASLTLGEPVGGMTPHPQDRNLAIERKSDANGQETRLLSALTGFVRHLDMAR
jgi:hypothetical protein